MLWKVLFPNMVILCCDIFCVWILLYITMLDGPLSGMVSLLFVLGEVPFLTMLDDLILTWLDSCYVDSCMIGEI